MLELTRLLELARSVQASRVRRPALSLGALLVLGCRRRLDAPQQPFSKGGQGPAWQPKVSCGAAPVRSRHRLLSLRGFALSLSLSLSVRGSAL